MIKLRYQGLTHPQILVALHQKFPEVRLPSRRALYKIMKKFEEEGEVANQNKGASGRPRSARTQAKILEIRRSLEIEKTFSIGEIRSSAR
jgi:transposase